MPSRSDRRICVAQTCKVENDSIRTPDVGLNSRRMRNIAGLASVGVPFAIVVHLIAEAAALGHDGLDVDFVARHGYFAALVSAAVWWFAATVGVGKPSAERRRRCAILRADLAALRGSRGLLVLGVAQLAFFGTTQAVEGVPIASGAAALGLGIAFAGSLLSACVVFFFGRSLIVAGLEAAIGCLPSRLAPASIARRKRAVVGPRRAASAFTLFVPNRPPPFASQI